MVRKGSSVRVRQRALAFVLLRGLFWARRCADPFLRVHLASTAWTSAPVPAAVGVEEVDRVLAAVAGAVAVVAVDHRQAGAHVAGEVEVGDALCSSSRRAWIASARCSSSSPLAIASSSIQSGSSGWRSLGSSQSAGGGRPRGVFAWLDDVPSVGLTGFGTPSPWLRLSGLLEGAQSRGSRVGCRSRVTRGCLGLSALRACL